MMAFDIMGSEPKRVGEVDFDAGSPELIDISSIPSFYAATLHGTDVFIAKAFLLKIRGSHDVANRALNGP